jgi:hypothetical protein
MRATLLEPDTATAESWRGEASPPRWGGIIAGVFVTLAVLVVLGEIGVATGLSSFEPGDRAVSYAWGAGIWGFLSVAVAFFLGGGTAACLSRLGTPRTGLFHGSMVWAVAVPLIGFLGAVLAIGAVTAGSVTAAAAAAVDSATPAPDALTPQERADATRARREATSPATIREASKVAGATGWAMVGGLLLALGAATAGGRLGVHDRVRMETSVPYTEQRRGERND